MEMNQVKIEEIRKNTDRLIDFLNISYTLDELINDFKKIYFNMDGDDNRLKIMGNIHFEEAGKQKQKSIQLYRLSKKDRNLMNLSSLGDRLEDVMELCFLIEQLKLVKKIDDIQVEINNIPSYVVAKQDELSKFFERKKK